MKTYDIDEVKTRFLQLVESAANGESFVIAIAGKQKVKVIPVEPPESSTMHRFGFMADQINLPDDFDTMGELEIQYLFENGS